MRSKSSYELVNKDRVLLEFERICEQVGPVALLDVKQDSPLVRAVDCVLQHGLRDPVRGYWSLVRSLTHSTTLKSLEAFVKYISSSQQKGLAWTFYTMEEGSLEYYLSSLVQDSRTVQQHYLDLGLLRDIRMTERIVAAITTLRAEAAAIQTSMERSLDSLTSPVDSGVALVDSDNSNSDGEKHEECTQNQEEEHHGWKQVFGSSVTTEVSTSSDNTLADENAASDQRNSNTVQAEQPPDNKIKSSIILQNKYDGVCRRPRKKKKSESGKRVSFHQDSNDDSDPVTLSQPSNINNFYVEGRYSWAGEGDSFFTKEKENFRQVKSEIYERKGLSSSVSIFESELGIEADCDSSTTTLDDAKHNIEIVCEKLSNVVKQSLGLKPKEKTEVQNINANLKSGEDQRDLYKSLLISERGAPEGQEDPKVMPEYERLWTSHQRSLAAMRTSVDLTSDSEWSLDTPDRFVKRQNFIKHPGSQRSTSTPNWPARVLHEAPSKTSLVKRFLRSIPTRKPYKEKKQIQKPTLYIKGVRPDPDLSQDLLKQLEEEIKGNQWAKKKGEDEIVTEAMKTAMETNVLMNNDEKIYKVYRVASTEGVPLLAVLTDHGLYMTGLGSNLEYSRRHYISHLSLDSVLIGPEYQTIMLVTVEPRVTVTVISALGELIVSHLVSHLVLAATRVAKAQPSVRVLQLSGMQSLYKALIAQTSITEGEKLLYYRYIRVEDSNMSGPASPQGPSRSGHLMYRPHAHSPWLPGFIVLKGGVLYVFSDMHQKSPKHVLSLHRGYFGGCRRVFNSNRPHTFEILPFSQKGLYGTFQFAAADDYDTSDWLQSFIQTSSILCESLGGTEEPLLGCGLLMTSQHLLTLEFPDTVLSCVRIQDITTIRTATTCCVLETSCREVQDNGGDWVLYFLTEQAIAEFLDNLYLLQPELKQVEVKTWECGALHRHCVQTSQQVRGAWDPLLLVQPQHSSTQPVQLTGSRSAFTMQ